MENTSTTSKDNLEIVDSDSDSDSSSSSDSSLEDTVEQKQVNKKEHKKIKPLFKIKQNDYAIKPVKQNAITKQIVSMQGPLYTLLKNRDGHNLILKSLNKNELKTIKNIISSVEQLKNIKAKRGFYQLPQETVLAFKKCKNKIESFKKATTKKDMLDACLALNDVDNFKSLRDILAANDKLYSMNRRISSKRNFKYGTK